MNRRRTLPSTTKWSPMARSAERCVRCGSWPDQRLYPWAVTDANFRYIGRRHDGRWLTLCPPCAERVARHDADLLATGAWTDLPWPERGRRTPDVRLLEDDLPLAPGACVRAGPAMLQAARLCLPRGLPWVAWRVLLQELGVRRQVYERLSWT